MADIYPSNAVTQRCQDRHVPPATPGTQACCPCLLPPLFIIYKIKLNTLQRTSPRLSCDHVLPQPSAHGQPASRPVLSLPGGAGHCAVQLREDHAPRPPWHPCVVQGPCSGLEGAATCLFCSFAKIASPRVTENKANESLTSPDGASRIWPSLTSQAGASLCHSLIH